jgi:hypothetical protein
MTCATRSRPTTATSSSYGRHTPSTCTTRGRLPLGVAGVHVRSTNEGHRAAYWLSLRAKTIELMHQNVHVDAVHDHLDKIVLDADALEAVLGTLDPKKKKFKEIKIEISKRLRQQ